MSLSKTKLAFDSIKAIAKNIAEGNDIKVSEEEKTRRLEVCKGCPALQDLAGQMQCGDCGCFLRIKAGLNSMVCTRKNW
mgnify:CR=1 FL=1